MAHSLETGGAPDIATELVVGALCFLVLRICFFFHLTPAKFLEDAVTEV